MRLIDADTLKETFIVNTDRKGYLVADPEVIIDNAPTVEQKYYERVIAQINPVIEARPKGEWITFPTSRLIMQCPKCTAFLSRTRSDIFKDSIGEMNFCPNCGADMRKPNCVTCDHFGDCEVCEKGEEE